MRVFLTGGGGLLGKSFISSPSASGHKIAAPTSRELDLRDGEAVLDAFRKFAPDCVVHAAAVVGGIHAKLREPFRYLSDSVLISTNVIRSAKLLGVRALLNVGSSAMYPAGLTEPVRPDVLLCGSLDPANEGYGLAKIVAARLTEYAGREDAQFAYKTIVPCNLYGPYDHFEPGRAHIIPSIIQKMVDAVESRAESVEIWGDGSARRELMFAGDLADFMWSVLPGLDRLPAIMNVGTGVQHTVKECYETAAEVVGFVGKFHHNLDQPSGSLTSPLDVRDQELLGWCPPTGLHEGLAKTHRFYIEGRDA